MQKELYLMLSMLGKKFSRHHFKIYVFCFFQKIGFDSDLHGISYPIFLGKEENNSLSSADLPVAW